MSQEELASACFERRIRVSTSSIKRAETGHPVLLRIAHELARYFDVPVTRLTRGVQPVELADDHEADEAAVFALTATPQTTTPPRPIIGRTPELRQFELGLRNYALEGRGFVLQLHGDPGIGKSRLLAQYLHIAEAAGVARVLSPVQHESGCAWYEPLAGLVRLLIGATEATGDAELADMLAARAGALRLADAEQLQLLQFLGCPLPDRLPNRPDLVQDALDLGPRQVSVEQALLRLLGQFGRPLLIAVDDIQWADPNLLLVLRQVAAGIVNLPVLLVLTRRADDEAAAQVWDSGVMSTPSVTIKLSPLSLVDAEEMASRFGALPEGFRSHCARLAEGNPLFLEQLLLNFEQSPAELPASMDRHVQVKLARLSGADRAAIEAAAALGDVFGLDALRELTAHADYQADELIAQHLLTRHADGQLSFCHSLIRQSIYGSLQSTELRALHGRIAAWYHDRHPTLHAHHLAAAQRLNAPQAYLNAAETMYEQRNYVDALTLVDKALSLAVPAADRYELVRLKAMLLKLLGLPEKSLFYLLEAAELACDDQQRGQAWCELADTHIRLERPADALRALQQVDLLLAQGVYSKRQQARIAAMRQTLGLGTTDDDAFSEGELAQMTAAVDMQEGVSDILRDLSSRLDLQQPARAHTACVANSAGAHISSRELRVGVLHSQTGILRDLEAGVLRATLLAFQEINEQGGLLGRRIVPTVVDGRSSETVFMEQAAHLVAKDDIVTLFGCSTSSSRRRVKPLIDDNEHLLFYPFQYEGIESSPNIAYVGPAPNQQAIPAVNWLVGKGCRRFVLIGSEYVYPVVTNEVIKDRIAAAGGTVVAEQYFGLGCRDFRRAVETLQAHEADAVILTIVGLDGNHAFLQQLHHAACRPAPTLLSLVLSEDDLAKIPAEYTAGTYTVFSYFQNIDHPLNQDFVRRYRRRFGQGWRIGGYMESAYVGAFLWAKSVQKADSLDRRQIKAAMKGISHFGPGGMAYIDEANNHVWRHVRVAQVGRDGEYHVAWSSARPVRPEPYPPCKSVDQWHAYLRSLRDGWQGRWESPPTVTSS